MTISTQNKRVRAYIAPRNTKFECATMLHVPFGLPQGTQTLGLHIHWSIGALHHVLGKRKHSVENNKNVKKLNGVYKRGLWRFCLIHVLQAGIGGAVIFDT